MPGASSGHYGQGDVSAISENVNDPSLGEYFTYQRQGKRVKGRLLDHKPMLWGYGMSEPAASQLPDISHDRPPGK